MFTTMDLVILFMRLYPKEIIDILLKDLYTRIYIDFNEIIQPVWVWGISEPQDRINILSLAYTFEKFNEDLEVKMEENITRKARYKIVYKILA